MFWRAICTSACAVRGRVVRRGRAARDGSNGSVREREGVCGGGGGGACGGATRRMAVAACVCVHSSQGNEGLT
jgi:hypothetical protein